MAILGSEDMSAEERVREGQEFFQSLYGDHKVKLPQAELHDRNTDKDKPGGNRFVEGKSRFAAFGMRLEGFLRGRIDKADDGVEIFYCPTPMTENEGRKKYQVREAYVAFSDADYGLTNEAHARLTSLGAGLNQSGGVTEDGRIKYHIYLRLSRAVTLEELEKINRGLKIYVNGDKFDATSLLRIPGMRNHKYQGSPLVRVERLASKTHTPEALMEMFPVPVGTVSGVELAGLKLPEIPTDFRWTENKPGYFKVRREVRNWNGRYSAGNTPHRYAAAIAIVKECIKNGLSVDVAYGFAMECRPLLDKQAEENGYDIQKDIAKTYYRETKTQSSGLTVEEFTREAERNHKPAPTEPKAEDRPVIEPLVPKTFQNPNHDGPNPYSARDSRNYLDMAIFTSGDFKPLEPAYFSVEDQFFLLYPGMTHCIFGDSGSGKTWIVVAQIATELLLGRRVKYIDFENGAMTIGNRLRNVLGLPPEYLTPDRFKYMWFNDMPEPGQLDAEIQEEVDEGYDLVIIDGVDASLAMWNSDANKPVEIRKWYNSFPQKFADEGATVLMIDHTTKKASKDTPPKEQQPGGAGTKLAVLTGAAFFVHPKEGYELIPGRRGIVEAYVTRKDKDGFLKSRAQRNGHLFDFIIDTVDGKTVTSFEVAKEQDEPQAGITQVQGEERQVLEILAAAQSPMNVGAVGKAMPQGIRPATVTKVLARLIELGYVVQEQQPGSRAKLNSITSLGRDVLAGKASASPPSSSPGETTLDFTRSDRMPTGAKTHRDCRKCGDPTLYPDDFAQPDDIGYNPKRPMCKSCAGENIDSEPADGPEWARGIRERITGRRSPRNRRESS